MASGLPSYTKQVLIKPASFPVIGVATPNMFARSINKRGTAGKSPCRDDAMVGVRKDPLVGVAD